MSSFDDNRLRDFVSARKRTWKPQLPCWPNKMCPVTHSNIADSDQSSSSTERLYINLAELLRVMTCDRVWKAQDFGIMLCEDSRLI
jgi:hypothetical protein